MIRFPYIPQLTDGQTLGATHLNAYRSALLYLLGEGHGTSPIPSAPWPDEDRYEVEWYTVWTGYGHLGSKQLFYLIRCGQNSGGSKLWHARLQYYADDSTWRDAVSLSGTQYWHVESATVDLTGKPSLTTGRIYLWRWQVRTTDATYNTLFEQWVTCLRGAPAGWIAPPAFVEGAVSAAAPLNTLRTDVQDLYSNMIPATVPGHMNGYLDRGWNGSLDWQVVSYATLRYRLPNLDAGIRFKLTSGRAIAWRVKLRTTGGAETVVYTSGSIPSLHHDAWKYAAASISLGGFGFAVGTYYRVVVEAKLNQLDGEWLNIQTIALAQWSAGTPAAGWQAMRKWQHGDANVAAAELNKLSSNLTMLYSGGEALWAETPLVPTAGAGLDEGTLLYLRHRKRWLLYYYTSEKAPTIHYGIDYGQSQSLPQNGTGKWHAYDLGQIADIPWGGGYLLSNVLRAMESGVTV